MKVFFLYAVKNNILAIKMQESLSFVEVMIRSTIWIMPWQFWKSIRTIRITTLSKNCFPGQISCQKFTGANLKQLICKLGRRRQRSPNETVLMVYRIRTCNVIWCHIRKLKNMNILEDSWKFVFCSRRRKISQFSILFIWPIL